MSKEKKNLITLSGEDEDIIVEVIDQTVVEGITYLLVADVTDEEDESDCYILKEINTSNDEVNYEVASDEESDKVFEVFSNMLKEDVNMKKE